MSRYLGGDCESIFRNSYRTRLDRAIYRLTKDYDDMDFDNAREKEVDIRSQLDHMENLLKQAQSELNSMSFE